MPGATAVPVPRAVRAPRPPASTWFSAVAAIAVVAALAAAGRFVGDSLLGTCTGVGSCAQAGQWLERGFAAQLALGAVGVLLLVATALRRARGVRRIAVLVIVLAVAVFFGSTLLAARSV